MLFLKRLLTALVCLAVLFVVLRTLALGIGGGIAGVQATSALQQSGQAAPTNFQEGMRVGAQAGIKFRAQYGQIVGLSALGVAAVGALLLSFGGAFPWCRAVKPPPPLPADGRYYGPPR